MGSVIRILHIIIIAAELHGVFTAPYLVSVDWSSVAAISRLRPTLQIVPNPMSYPGSPVHDAVWGSLQTLNASNVRLQLWLPYPRMSVAELEPPSRAALCGFRRGDSQLFNNFTLDCGEGSTIASVDFAAYGSSSGYCGSLAEGSCISPNAHASVVAACLGKRACTIEGSAEWMGGAAPCSSPSTAVQVTCSGTANHSYWDFSRMWVLIG